MRRAIEAGLGCHFTRRMGRNRRLPGAVNDHDARTVRPPRAASATVPMVSLRRLTAASNIRESFVGAELRLRPVGHGQRTAPKKGTVLFYCIVSGFRLAACTAASKICASPVPAGLQARRRSAPEGVGRTPSFMVSRSRDCGMANCFAVPFLPLWGCGGGWGIRANISREEGNTSLPSSAGEVSGPDPSREFLMLARRGGWG